MEKLSLLLMLVMEDVRSFGNLNPGLTRSTLSPRLTASIIQESLSG